ncbi:DedA family protein [Nevskia soli]|jgi:membrane-associated protein|uniref:DedA family protein n=1 Tax=Nevskia soli TaxID=418856 RepID=UPI0015D8C153|nr:VTT domain-containing protein [Nevskia soli]
MHAFLDFLKSLTDPHRLAAMLSSQFSGWLGYGLLSLIIFGETGLLAGFFLPGDSLLFSVGVVCGFGFLKLPVLIGVLICAAIIGDNTGYFLGRSAGPLVFSRPRSRLFNPDHIQRAKEFYERYGGRAIVYARFVPVIRTCMPFMAGVAGMPYTRFLTFSVFGGAGWIAAMTLLGYKLGSVPVIQKNIEVVVLAIVVISLLPVALQFVRRRSTSAA